MSYLSKSANRRLLNAGVFVLATALATPSLAESSPSQLDFARALRPIPMALRGGHQGLPTVGSPMRPAPSLNYAAASAVSYKIGSEPRRTAAAQHQIKLAQTNAAQHSGCPAQAAADSKPMIGFKVAFEFGSAELKSESLETLRHLGAALNQDLTDQTRFEIQGHTDAVGTRAYNERLSTARAEAVKEFLIGEMGVAPERLAASGKGYCEPADRRDPYAAANRRVVVLNQSS